MTKSLIEEKLSGRYRNFLKYCQESRKNFIEELDSGDFIAYRTEYAVSHEDIKQLKNLLDFQEKIPTEEISSPQDGFNDSEEILQKYFNINDLTPYENIYLVDLDFSVRVKNCLRRNDYRTLAELLRTSQQKLSSLQNFDRDSLDNLLSTLKKFFDSRRKKISDLVTIKSLFRDLPFKDKRVQPFLLACSLKEPNFFLSGLPADLTFAELPEYLTENSIEFDTAKLKNFADALRFDMKACAKKIFDSVFKDKREFNILCRLAEGDTYKKIGENVGLSRERVRQIEREVFSRFDRYCSDARKIFYFLHALNDGNFLLTPDDVKNFLDTDYAQKLWFFVAKTNLSSGVFHFDEVLNAVVFADENILEKNDLIKNLPDIMDEKFFEESIIRLARERKYPVELIKLKLSKIYKRSGKIFHRETLTPTFKCKYILKERFTNGYKISDETYYSRFIRYLQEIFDEKTIINQRALGTLISTIGVLCDRGKYIHPDFVHISPEIIERVKNFIDGSDRTAIFYKEIFETLKEFFIDTQITNHYFLQGAIKFHNLPYILRKDYLTKASEIDMAKEFDSFVAERGEVSTQEIKENFISFKDFNIAFLAGRCPEIIRIGDGKFLHASRLKLEADDFESIKKFLLQNCSTPINSRVLFDLFFERFADFMARNEIHDHDKLFGVLQYMFHDDFNFSHQYISITDIKDINNKKILNHILADTDEIKIEDLIATATDHGISYSHKKRFIDNLFPYFIRVDEFTLMRPELIGVTDEIISAVVKSIQSAVERNGGWQAAKNFDDYEWLPQLAVSWNSFLLESIATLAEDALCKIKIPSTSTNFSLAIFVAEEFAEDDFQSFLTKILIAEHNKEPFRTEKEIFDWLKAQGLCNKKLPKFLEGGRAFELLGEGS